MCTKSRAFVSFLLLFIFSSVSAQDKVVVVPLMGDSITPSGVFTIQPIALRPLSRNGTYYSQGNESVLGESDLYLYCYNGQTTDDFQAPVYLPDGVTIARFTLSSRDTSNQARIQASLGKVCQLNGSASPVYTALTSAIGTSTNYAGGNTYQSDTTIGEVVDNRNCSYHVAVSLAGSAGLVNCQGPNVLFYRAQVFWER